MNQKHDPEDKAHIVRLIDSFEYQKHLCLVFELLRINLYELIKMNQHRGFSMNLVRIFLKQIIEAQIVLTRAQCIHCDLKPENILLCDLSSPHIKIIDFGSACYENRTIYTYIQSRFYRSPEVILGTNYTSAIDLWSIGCIAAELFFGLPLFPGHSEYNQLQRIIDMLGVPPESMLEKGKNINKYFTVTSSPTGARKFQLKSEQLYALETGTQPQPSKRYFAYKTLPENVEKFSNKKLNASDELSPDELHQRRCFTHFLLGLLHLDPSLRWTAEQAIDHPFITGAPFDGTWAPLEKQKPILQSTGIPIPITNSNYAFVRDASPRQSGPSSLPMNLTHYSPQSFQLGQSPSTGSPLTSQGNPANLTPHGYISMNPPHPGQAYPMYAANLHIQNRSHMNPASSGGPSPVYTTGGRPRASTRDAFVSGSNASYFGGYRSKQQIASQNPQGASSNGKEPFSVTHQSPASRNNSHSPTTKFNPNSNSSVQATNPRQKNTRHRKTLSSTGQFPSSSKPDRSAHSPASTSLSNSHPNVSNQAFAPGPTEQYYVPPMWTPANPNQNTNVSKPPSSSGHYPRRRSVTEDDEAIAPWDPFYDEDDHPSPTGKKSKSPVQYSGRQGSGGIQGQYMGTIPSPSNFSSSHMNPLSMNVHPSLPPGGGKGALSSSLNIPTSNHPGYLPMAPPISRSGGYPFPNYPADYTGSLGTSPMGPPTLFGYPGFSQGTPTRMRPYVPPSQPQNVPTVGSASGGFVYPTSEPEYFPSIDPSPRTHGFEFVPLGSSYEKPAFADPSSRQPLRNTDQQPVGTGYPVVDNRDKSKPTKSVRRYPTYPAKEK